MNRPRLVRMCGGGIPVLRRRFWWRYRDPITRQIKPLQWRYMLPRRTAGAIVLDWPGVALQWGWTR